MDGGTKGPWAGVTTRVLHMPGCLLPVPHQTHHPPPSCPWVSELPQPCSDATPVPASPPFRPPCLSTALCPLRCASEQEPPPPLPALSPASICSCIMMFVTEVTFQSNEAPVTMCERCDNFSLGEQRRVDRPELGPALRPGLVPEPACLLSRLVPECPAWDGAPSTATRGHRKTGNDLGSGALVLGIRRDHRSHWEKQPSSGPRGQ